MNKKKLNRIQRHMRALRSKSASLRKNDLVGVAKALGRSRFNRGKEPTYVSTPFPDLRPVSIPSHPGTLKRFTALGILDQLEDDVLRWEETLESDNDSDEGTHE